MVQGCVIGAGPSGLFTAKYLALNGIPVSIYEKDSEVLGNYRYAIDKKIDPRKILQNEKITLHLNKDHTAIDRSQCDFYVAATGGVPRRLDIKGSECFVPALDAIKGLKDKESASSRNRICILGLGNVTLDLLWYLSGKCQEAVIFSRHSADTAPIDPHVLQKLLESRKWQMFSDQMPKDISTRRAKRRVDIFKEHVNIERRNDRAVPIAKLMFEKDVTEAEALKDGRVQITYSDTNGLHKAIFDCAISSIGFVPNTIKVEEDKPVFYTGWCVEPRGNITKSMDHAQKCVQQVLKVFGKDR